MDSSKSVKIANNAVLNTLKQAADVIFPLITVPYITRVLGTGNYGKVNFSDSIVGYLTIFSLFGVTSYAIREGAKRRNNKREVSQFTSELFTLNILASLISYVALFFLLFFWTKLFQYRLLIIILSSSVLFSVIGMEHIYTIYEDFKYITIRSLLIKLFCLIALIVFVHEPSDYYVYAIILVVSSVGSNVFNFFYSRKYIKTHLVFDTKIFSHIKTMAVFFFNSLLIMLYVNSDITMLGIICGDEVTGIYSLSAKIYNIVKRLINAITTVAVPQAVELKKNNDEKSYTKLLNVLFEAILVVVFPAITGLFCLSENLVCFISGEDFILSAQSLRILCFSMPFAVISNFLISLISIPYNKEKSVLIATSISAFANIVLNFILIPFGGQNAAALTTVIAEIIVFVLTFITMCRLNIKLRVSARDIISVIIGCCLVICICYFINHLNFNLYVETIVSIIVSIILYSVTMFVFKNSFTGFVFKVINKRIKK